MTTMAFIGEKDNQMFGYAFSLPAGTEFMRHVSQCATYLKQSGFKDYATHLLRLPKDKTLAEYDPYFQDTIFVNSIEAFITEMTANTVAK